ncbi:MAG TPA: DJ-1/PfpI family protein [Candidatus Tumulicola sp.]|jgi:transcriptional regulator GlxA family with amidase domain
MNRRQILGAAIASGLALGTGTRGSARSLSPVPAKPIPIPKDGRIKVAFVISSGANVIDLAGPWETFQDTILPNGDMPFELFTVAETTQIVEMTDGLRVEPTYSFDAVPRPNVVVVPAQSNASPRFMGLLREIQGEVDLTMSICTGAFKLAKAGILDGKSATTHHDYYDAFAKEFPKVTLVRGPRFVDEGSIVTAGGLTSGISAALHVVARYFDATFSARTADYMEFVPSDRPA